jgi:hypothetical protein
VALATPGAQTAVGSLVRTRGRDWVVLAVVVQPATIGRLLHAMPRSDVSLYQYYPNSLVVRYETKAEAQRKCDGDCRDAKPGACASVQPHLVPGWEAHRLFRRLR